MLMVKLSVLEAEHILYTLEEVGDFIMNEGQCGLEDQIDAAAEIIKANMAHTIDEEIPDV